MEFNNDTNVFECSGKERNIYSDKTYNMLRDGISVKSLLHAAQYEKDICKSDFIKLPIYLNSEAQAFGADIIIDEKGIRILQYKYDSLDEFIKTIPNYTEVFQVQIIECIKQLKLEPVLLKATGAFSILATLIEPFKLYKSMKKEPEKLHKALSFINERLSLYIIDALKSGAFVISFADPMGLYALMGKNSYIEFIADYQKELFLSLVPYLTSSILHLCGKNSVDLQRVGFIKKEQLECSQLTYGKELLKRAEDPDFKICGFGCINEEDEKKQWIYKLTMI